MSEDKPPTPEAQQKNPETDQAVAISPEIKLVIQAEIRDQLDRERTILRDAGTLALKIIGGAFALLIAIFTVFGLTTWKEIANQTTDYAKQRVDALIQNRESETGVTQILNNLVNRAILAAELTSLSRRTVQNQAGLDLRQFEWDRLKAWLKLESLERQEFQDTLAILDAQSPERKAADANSFLSEMLDPPAASPYRWIVSQPEKRLAIMENFTHPDLGSSAVGLAASSASERLRLAALEYIGRIKYTDGFEKIIAIASSTDDGELKTEALLTSAKLRPTHRLFLAELTKLMSEPNPTSMNAAIKIVLQFWDPWPYFDDAATEAQVLATSKELLAFALNGGVYIDLDDFGPMGRFAVFKVPGKFNSVSMRPEPFGRLEPYWEMLADAANAADLKKLSAYMFSGPLPGIAAEATLGKESWLVVNSEAGTDITLRANDGAEIFLQPIQRSSGKLRVQWTKDNQTFQGTISSLSGKDFKFSFHQASTAPR